MSEALLPVLGLVCFFLAFFGVTTPILYVINRAIGRSYDEKRRALFGRVEATERVLLAEDDVPMSLRSIALLAVGIQWRKVDVRITERALYVAQYGKFLGLKMGQPTIVVALTPMGLDPACVTLGYVMHGAGQPQLTEDGRAIEMPLETSRSKHRLRLELRQPGEAIRTIETVMYR